MSTTSTLEHDPVFSSMAEFQVEGVIFRLPAYIFKQSSYFRDSVLTPDGWEVAEAPYELQDTTAAEFRDFLRCILPMADSFPSGPAALTNVLKLATRWKFDYARTLAIRKIVHCGRPALKLALARAYDVKEFLPGALHGLVEAEALEVEDYEVLPLELACKVVKYRERTWRCAAHRLTGESYAGDADWRRPTFYQQQPVGLVW